jgi:hypothetical protein
MYIKAQNQNFGLFLLLPCAVQDNLHLRITPDCFPSAHRRTQTEN